MLMQNWFYQPNMEMFYDYGDCQKFYDKNSHAIYVVEETIEGIRIREIQETSDNYNLHYNVYLEWKSDNMPVKLFIQEVERYLCNYCSDDDIEELYENGTIDISMCGLTTKIPWGADPYNKIINALNSLVNNEEVE